MTQKKCILLAGNHKQSLTGIQNLIIAQQPDIDIVVCTPVEILQHVYDCKPAMVLFYLANAESTYAAYIKELRDNEAFDEVPLYIYSTLPTENDITALLEKLA